MQWKGLIVLDRGAWRRRFRWISLDPICRLPGKPGTRESDVPWPFPPALGTASYADLSMSFGVDKRGICMRDK